MSLVEARQKMERKWQASKKDYGSCLLRLGGNREFLWSNHQLELAGNYSLYWGKLGGGAVKRGRPSGDIFSTQFCKLRTTGSSQSTVYNSFVIVIYQNMLISFNNQYQNYPIVLVPDKIRNQLQFDVDENIIASELGISKPKKTQLRKPQPPSKYTYKEVSKVTIEYSNELVYLFFAFIISIYLGSSFEGEAFKATLIIFAGWTTFFLLFKFIFEDGVKIFKTSKIYIEKERDTKEFHELEIEYQQNLFQYNNKYNIIENGIYRTIENLQCGNYFK